MVRPMTQALIDQDAAHVREWAWCPEMDDYRARTALTLCLSDLRRCMDAAADPELAARFRVAGWLQVLSESA